MRVANILVCHSFHPSKLLQSIPESDEHLWFAFFHGSDKSLSRDIEDLIVSRGGIFFPYFENRGLAKSWNQGLFLARQCSCDVSLLLNDDLYFYPGGYRLFVDAIYHKQNSDPDLSYMSCIGLEAGESPYRGQSIPQMFACCSISPAALNRIGYFDETFVPAYYEDFDYHRRSELCGMHGFVDSRTLVEHERSSTLRVVKSGSLFSAIEENKVRFIEKWGAEEAVYNHPFNDASMRIFQPWGFKSGRGRL